MLGFTGPRFVSAVPASSGIDAALVVGSITLVGVADGQEGIAEPEAYFIVRDADGNPIEGFGLKTAWAWQSVAALGAGSQCTVLSNPGGLVTDATGALTVRGNFDSAGAYFLNVAIDAVSMSAAVNIDPP
jgi:hypothetical protein